MKPIIKERTGQFEIKVGDRVSIGDPSEPTERGTVLHISEPDGDVNDYGRPVAIGPYVTVRFDDDEEDTFVASMEIKGWGDYMREDLPYVADDLDLLDPEEYPEPVYENDDDGLSDPDMYYEHVIKPRQRGL